MCCCDNIGVFTANPMLVFPMLRVVLHFPCVGHYCVHATGVAWGRMGCCMSCDMRGNRISSNDMCGSLSGCMPSVLGNRSPISDVCGVRSNCMPIGSVCGIHIKYICIGNYTAVGSNTTNCIPIGAFISIGNIRGDRMSIVGCGYIDNMYCCCFGFLLDFPMGQRDQAEKIFGNPTSLL